MIEPHNFNNSKQDCSIFGNSLKSNNLNLGEPAMLRTVLLVILILALIGALPAWPYSSGWGYYPSGGLGLVVLILLILALTGRL
jgi:hypothetical protein